MFSANGVGFLSNKKCGIVKDRRQDAILSAVALVNSNDHETRSHTEIQWTDQNTLGSAGPRSFRKKHLE